MFSQNSKVSQEIYTQLIDRLGSLLYKDVLQLDSRKAGSESIFCAYPGTVTDSRQFIESAINNGTDFILWEDGFADNAGFQSKIPNYPVKNLMLYVGLLAATRLDFPSLKFKTIGVTGTNGKTSISHWLSQVYCLLGKKSGIIGTTGAGIYPEVVYNDATTPDPLTLQNILAGFADKKVDVVTMEVSSHALHQGRVNGIHFNTAIFTNLTQDHLDYHNNMENYYQAKRDLFFWNGLTEAVINADDLYGARLLNELSQTGMVLLDYGINNGSLQAKNIRVTITGMEFDLNYKSEISHCKVKVIGKFNVYNLLAVAATLLLEGYPLQQITQLLSELTPVCGRMDAIIIPEKPLVVIDFSHTPDSLQNALTTLREVEHSGKLYCVFGCGGNRDNSKRPIMGSIAASIADYAIVTSDNPRFEAPEIIIEQILQGMQSQNFTAITDRKEAIKQVFQYAKAGDIVLIAGKGHETYQEIKGVKYPFSDFDIARSFLEL